MPRSPAALEALIRELDEVRGMAGYQDDATLSDASLAVYRALSTLQEIGRRRFHARPPRDESGDEVVSDARRALARARETLARAAQVRALRMGAAAGSAPGGGGQPAAVAVACCGCGRRFFVQYLGGPEAALVAVPVDCPSEDCDAVTDVAYPEDAVDVQVVPVVR